MYTTKFDLLHKKQVERIFKDGNQSDQRVGEKLAEYSALSGVPVIDCYKMYISSFGKTEFATERLLDLQKRNG